MKACAEALGSLKGNFGIMSDSIQSAKRTLQNRFRGEALSNRFWVEKLCETQIESIPLKTLSCLTDFESVLGGITQQDVQFLVEELNFCEENYTQCVGITSSAPGPARQLAPNSMQKVEYLAETETDVSVPSATEHQAPSLGRRR